MNLNEQLKNAGANAKFDQEVQEMINEAIAMLKIHGQAHMEFCDATNWKHRTRHMRRIAEYFRKEGLSVRTEYKYEVYDLYIEVQ